MNKSVRFFVLSVMMLLLIALPVGAQDDPLTIDFYFPEATANNAQGIFEEYAEMFSADNPTIQINVVYQGSYTDLRTIAQTQLAAGEGPDVAVMLATDLLSFVEDGSIVSAQGFIDSMDGADEYVSDFYHAFLLNSEDETGEIWTIPYQRSTPLLYYNTELFAEAGIEQAPQNRDELLEVAQALTTDDRWGLWFPSEGFPIWLFSAFQIAAGEPLVAESFEEVYFNTDATMEGLDYLLSLSGEYGVMPAGGLSWGDGPTIFTSGEAAMLVHTTGSLTRILNEADFEVGTAFLPFGPAGDDGTGFGAPTGGGNLYIFANSSPEEQAAAWEWVEFLSSPEIQADWTTRTGYIAARASAWDTEPLASLVESTPQYALARDQLEFAGKEFTSYRSIDVQNIINTTLGGIIAGDESDIAGALESAQAQIDSLLAE
jgi:sn-glycerol 3-phosphate transport system substrate-binding protein